MKAQILFFGATADISGTRQIEVDTHSGTNAGDILNQLLRKFPRLSSHRLLLAINEKYATGDEIVRDGDELAIFTAVSGG